jgi:hypothetical protein
MPEYRAYIEGSDEDGHFVYFHPLICADDTEATEKAKQLVVGHAVELWCGERLVMRLERKPKQGSAHELF